MDGVQSLSTCMEKGMDIAESIVHALYSRDWSKIEEAYACYHQTSDDEIMEALIVADKGFSVLKTQILLEGEKNLELVLRVNIMDEVICDGDIVVDEHRSPGGKIEYSYGGITWTLQGNNAAHLLELMPFIKGDCCEPDMVTLIHESMDISKPGNDVYFQFHGEDLAIRSVYDGDFEESTHDAFQYAEGLAHCIYDCSINGFRVPIQNVPVLLLFLGMRQGIAIHAVQPHELGALAESHEHLIRWAVRLHPHTKPRDWYCLI